MEARGQMSRRDAQTAQGQRERCSSGRGAVHRVQQVVRQGSRRPAGRLGVGMQVRRSAPDGDPGEGRHVQHEVHGAKEVDLVEGCVGKGTDG
jgi:hypothetical protein